MAKNKKIKGGKIDGNSRKIKVLQISSDSNIGGAGKCIITFLKNYNRDRFDVCAIVPRGSLLKPEMEETGTKVLEADKIAEKSLSIGGIREICKIIKKVKPDIVHTHGSMSGRIAAKLCGVKVVFTRHSVFEPSPKISKGIGKKINGFINNAAADEIIAVAEAAKDNLTATGVSEKKITVILNGVLPLEKYDDEKRRLTREKLGISQSCKAAAIVARLNPVKGHLYYVRAAKKVIDRGIDAKFFIAGTGECENEIREEIERLNLKDNVIMLGFLSDVEPLMNAVDLQINCSFGTEATSLSLLEGMSVGTPAVVTDFGGNPGVIEDGKNGFLVPIKNPEKMADKIAEIFENDELLKTLSQNAEAVYKEKFTQKVYTENIEAVYERNGGHKNEQA